MAKIKATQEVSATTNGLKNWIIKQAPEHSAARREDLRVIRKQLNKAAGVDEDSPEFKALTTLEKNNSLVYTLAKGPDHRHLTVA